MISRSSVVYKSIINEDQDKSILDQQVCNETMSVCYGKFEGHDGLWIFVSIIFT
jgi:hypothetical protein